MVHAIAILGTASDVGKSVIATALCRILYRAGVRVAPFKSQNMSLNSFVTVEGGEMGQAQVLQATACGLVPHVDMNPILLKPEADTRSQVVVQGRLWGTQDAHGYFGCKPELFGFVRESYERLANQNDVIIIEGAGSGAEVNLRSRDLVNWPVAELADASVILVADIDRGGVFAQVIGTLDLLEPEERRRVVGIVINKFRGDISLFHDGVTFIENRTQIPVLGVVPYLRNLELDQEDSLDVSLNHQSVFRSETVNIAVILLPHMSNFTDFNVLRAEKDVVVRYVSKPWELVGADVVMLPGTKMTIHDMTYLHQAGFGSWLREHVSRGGELVGLCGGFQMLGTEISDPDHAETGGGCKGFGLLQFSTELLTEKKTYQVRAIPLHIRNAEACSVTVYEIHMGITTRLAALPCFRILEGMFSSEDDGARSDDGLVWGTYIHGVFDEPGFRRTWIKRVRARKGLPILDISISEEVSARLAGALDRWADHIETHVNLTPMLSILGLR